MKKMHEQPTTSNRSSSPKPVNELPAPLNGWSATKRLPMPKYKSISPKKGFWKRFMPEKTVSSSSIFSSSRTARSTTYRQQRKRMAGMYCCRSTRKPFRKPIKYGLSVLIPSNTQQTTPIPIFRHQLNFWTRQTEE